MKFVNASGIPSNFVPPGDYTFWSLLNEAIQEEPSDGSDPTTLGLFASIGIEKGKPFNPDARMKKILTDAANIGAVTARAIAFRIRDKDAFFYPDSPWRLPFFGGYKFESHPAWPIWMAPPSFTISPLVSHRPWRRKWSVKVRNIPGRAGLRWQSVRWRKELQAAPAAEYSGEGLLVGHCL